MPAALFSRANDPSSGSLLALVRDSCSLPAAQAAGWSIGSGMDEWWIRVHNKHARRPDQGWKLHISASPGSVVEVLKRVIPVLLAEDAGFKVIASTGQLYDLNDGIAGLSQIGKSITVYPNSDQQAVRLAVALHEVTHGLRGPVVPSDRPLMPGSLIHYRYGSFAARQVQMPNGLIEWALLTPDGTLVPDVREVGYCAPEWAIDPFIAAGLVRDHAPLSPLIAGRYLVIETLAQSARGTVARGLDLRALRRCVLKRAVRDTQIGRSGQDARNRLRHEADMLRGLAPDKRVPQVFDLIEHGDDLILVIEDIGGETLEQRVTQLSRRGCMLTGAAVVALGRKLAGLLGMIHECGMVYRDLKPSNVILGRDDHLQLIDFELAYSLHAAAPPYGRGTRGYMSPQQASGAPPCAGDDIYSLGALLYFAATGAEPGFTPQPDAPLRRPPALINPALGLALIELIEQSLCSDPADRPASMMDLLVALEAIGEGAACVPPAFGTVRSLPDVSSRRHFRTLAYRLGNSLCQTAQTPPHGPAPVWASGLYRGSGIWARDLYAGSAGVLLALAELVVEFQDPQHTALLRQGASALLQAPRPGGAPLGGLYFGEAGVVLATLRAGQVLSDKLLIATAHDRGHFVARLPYRSPDLITGAAGRIRLHLLLWDQTADPEQLGHALTAGEWLLTTGTPFNDELCWMIPPGYGTLSGQTLLGYAHGAAGIGDALLDLFQASGDERFRYAAQAAARWIMRQALPALDDGSGLCWPKQPNGEPARAFWCHGATGIGRFLLHVAQAGGMPQAGLFAERAARTAARGTGWAGPSQCHGLAGQIEVLLDMFQATGSAAYLSETYALACLLETFIIEDMSVCQSDLPDVCTPDFMVGYGGVIMCLLRLGDPEDRPHQISRAGFRFMGP